MKRFALSVATLLCLCAAECPAQTARGPVSICTFLTKSDAEAAAVPPDVQAITTLGYFKPGRGGATYLSAGDQPPTFNTKQQANAPRPTSHYIVTKAAGSAKPRYFVLAEETPNVLQFGAIADASADGKSTQDPGKASKAFDNTQAFNDALQYGKALTVPTGRYWFDGTINFLQDGANLTGSGPGGANEGGAELYFGPGTADCLRLGDNESSLRWCKVSRLFIDASQRTGGNAIMVLFNAQLVLEDLRIVRPWNGIQLFRGLGFTLRNLWISGIRCGDGTKDGPTQIGYGIKISGAPELFDKTTGAKQKRETQVLYLENISFGSLKEETDPTNWTVGLWCAENGASTNGATIKNQNVRHGIYLSRADKVDPTDKLQVPDGYTLVPATWTDARGEKGPAGTTYAYGSKQYPSRPGTVVDSNRIYQDLTLFYCGGDFLGGEFLYDDEASGVAIYNPHFFRVYQGSGVYMGPKAKDLSIYGGQVIAPYMHCFDMNGQKWQISGTEIFKASVDADREAHKGKFSCVHVGATSIGGSVFNCKIGNELSGIDGRGSDTAKYGIDIEHGATATYYTGNSISGCLAGDVNNAAGSQTQSGNNVLIGSSK